MTAGWGQKRKVEIFTKSAAQAANTRMRELGRVPEREVLVKDQKPSPRRGRDSQSGVRTELRALLSSHKKRRMKANQRWKKFETRLRVTRGERGILEQASVREPQRTDYMNKLEGFYSFVVYNELEIHSEQKLDEALCDYGDHLYLDGYGSNYGEKLMAALECERPEFARSDVLGVPRFKRTLKGWRRLAPTQTRMPMLEFLKSAISGVMLRMGLRSMALYNEATFSTYSRPGEMLRVHAMDVVMPNQEFDQAVIQVIVLGPLERGESSKTGVYDEVLILDDKRASYLPELLHDLAQA